MLQNCPVSIFLAMSIDGYIAEPDGNLDFLDSIDHGEEDYGYHKFVSEVDTVLLGRHTYDKVMSFNVEFPHKDRKCYVFSNTLSNDETNQNVEFVNKPPDELINEIRNGGSKGIYCDGGANLIDQLHNDSLIDRYIISIIPVVLGSGISLFEHASKANLKLINSKSYPSGLVQLTYHSK